MVYPTIQTITILCFVIQYFYWLVTAVSTEQTKPKKKEKFSLIRFFQGQLYLFLELFIIIQILRHKTWIIPNASIMLPLVGLFLAILGLVICIIARKTLSGNWTNAHEYQIKENHQLIATGIYSVIRHPIYLGLILMLIGGEMVAESYLFISFFAFFIVFYVQGRKEEKLFLSHFGKEYQEYMHHTKMLIPFVL